MIRSVHIWLLCFFYLTNALANPSTDSLTKLRFQKLADKMRLKTAPLREGEYEIRFWNKQALLYGDAHVLYKLDKTNKTLHVSKLIIDSDKRGFRHLVELKPTKPITDTL